MAATYDVTPANGGANTVGTLESVANLKAFLITVKNDSNTAIDLRANDGAYGSNYELILRELQPVMAHATNDANGTISVIMDGHNQTAAALQERMRNIVVGLGLGTAVSANDTSVAEGTSFAVA